MLKNCCFCISLRTATLGLAILGAFTHLYGALTLTTLSDQFEDVDSNTVFGLTVYSYISGFACLAGAVGVLKNNVKKLSLFNAYYWVDLVLHTIFSVSSAFILFSIRQEMCKEIVNEIHEEDFDMMTCESVYIRSSWIISLAMAVNMLLKLHYAFAIHSYTKQIKQAQKEEELMNHVIVAPYPTAIISTKEVKEQPIFVAGQEFVPDEKK